MSMQTKAPNELIVMIDNIRGFAARGSETLRCTLDVPEGYSRAKNLILVGLGGSGIAGDITRDLYEGELSIPINICKGQSIPGFAGPDSLVVLMSYSGNTRETVDALRAALSRGCMVYGITSGGELGSVMREQGLPFATVPSGYRAREALPFTLFTLLNLLGRLGWRERRLDLGELASMRDEIEQGAIRLAYGLSGKRILIYTVHQSVGHRFKSELSENAKVIAKNELFPELCHNEANAWPNVDPLTHVVIMRTGWETGAAADAIDATKDLLPVEYTEVVARGRSNLTRLLYLIWMGDFTSYYLAMRTGVDPIPIHVTDVLKEEVALRASIPRATPSDVSTRLQPVGADGPPSGNEGTDLN